MALIAGCEMELATRDDGQTVMRSRYPVGVQEIRPGEFRVVELRDQRGRSD